MASSKKRPCKFTEALRKEFPFIKKRHTDHDVMCEKCNSAFSISSGGRSDITRHTNSDKHKKVCLASASSNEMGKYFRKKEFGDHEKQLAKAEAVYSFHTVCHHQSFRSMDCTTKIVQNLFETKFSCGRTKTEAIVKKVLAPYALQELKNELQLISYVSIYSDASNHKDLKLFPTLIRYFDFTTGIKIRVLDFVSLPGENSEIISNSVLKILEENGLSHKLVAFCADNTNTNFGGMRRKGNNNIFQKLNNLLEQEILGVGCAAHIVHNCMQTGADLLPVDVENIINKIYSHFYIYTVRVESLKEFCEEAEIEYNKILGSCKTRWLALQPAIERVLKMYNPLKSYFLSMDKCPKLIENFFRDNSSELWLKFIHAQSSLFHNTVKRIEGDKNTIFQVSHEVENLKLKLKERLHSEYVPLILKKDLTNLTENGDIDRHWFVSQVRMFYANCLQYLDSWSTHLSFSEDFRCIELEQLLEWKHVQVIHERIIEHFSNNNNIEENDLFDEFACVKNYVTEAKIAEWNSNKLGADLRWVEIFQHFSREHITFDNMNKIVEFALCMPGSNAAIERVFSLVNKLWTKDKTQLSVETVKAMLIVKCNLEKTCEEFSENLKGNIELLKQVHSSEKYL